MNDTSKQLVDAAEAELDGIDPAVPETCAPDGTHHWPGQASTESTPCLCGEKTMSVEYVDLGPAGDIEGGGE